jgi:hypothetical protein
MPEYLAPGVYVEETSFRAKSIEGVGTSTTAFVGPTRRGPVGGVPELVTSLPDFERIYGSLENLALGDVTLADRRLNFVAHAARAYFDNGGSRLYVVRTVNGAGGCSRTSARRRWHRRRERLPARALRRRSRQRPRLLPGSCPCRHRTQHGQRSGGKRSRHHRRRRRDTVRRERRHMG